MNFPDAFTLHRSEVATVRVEPPDVVIVELLAAQPFRFRRSHVRECSPMLVRYYRERFDPTYAAPDDGEIVVRFAVEGMPRELLGPFPHAAGIALADAINLARSVLLFAVPGFSVRISDDDASLVINAALRTMHLSIPVPTANLVELVPRDNDRLDVRHLIRTGLAPERSARWLEIRLAGDQPWLLGPLSSGDAAALALAFRAWRGEHPLDHDATPVEHGDLLADPARWHSRRIAVTGDWTFKFERSAFARVWLQPPSREQFGYGSYRVRVVGTWIYPDANAEDGYGHMSCWPGMLRAETIDILEVTRVADVHDGLTGLLTRAALTSRFNELRDTCSIALLDLDHFKRINDAHGHVAGDEVLQQWSVAVVAAVGEGAIVARWGGEELAVILGTSLEAATATIDHALRAVRALAITAGESEIHVTCSAGVVAMAGGESLGQAAARADDALYEAKRAGRDRLVTR